MRFLILVTACMCLLFSVAIAEETKEGGRELVTSKPTDSTLKVKVGDMAPDFTLTAAVTGKRVALSQYLGKKHVVLSFTPRAWDPVCSAQWPGYNMVKNIFDKHDAMLLGITVDNVETLLGWIKHLCAGDTSFWFPILSDFQPRGEVAAKYGVMRSDGYSERAIFVIDKKGTIRYIDVHDVAKIPPLEALVKELEKLE